MPFFIDPKDPVERVIDNITFKIRVFDGRERSRFVTHLLPLSRTWANVDDVEDAAVSMTEKDVDHMAEIVKLGVVGWSGPDAPECKLSRGYLSDRSLGRIPFERWSELLTAVVEVNTVTEDDEGNSQ